LVKASLVLAETLGILLQLTVDRVFLDVDWPELSEDMLSGQSNVHIDKSAGTVV
jgi:hypothetical protein